MDIIDNFKYKVIKGLLSQEEIKLIHEYCEIKHWENDGHFDFVQNNCGDTYFYKDALMEIIAKRKQKRIEKETGLELNRTYTFWRCYTNGADLKKHTDRDSCEISATLFIASDKKEWPIYMDGTRIDLEPGDAAIYKGCEVEHWREPFDGDYHIQVFLHFVNKHGKFANLEGDKRI